VVDIGLNKVVGYFDAEAHRYTDDNGTVYDSATQFVHSFEKPFDKEYWSHYKAKERGVPVEVILAEWDELNKASLVRGNRIHDALEDGLNNSASKSKQQKLLPTGSKLDTRFQKSIVITTVAQLRTIPIFLTYPYIRSYMEKLLFEGYTIYAEYRLYRPELSLAGTADVIAIKGDDIIIVDWKTNKKPMLFKSGYFKKKWQNGVKVETNTFIRTANKMLSPINHLDSCLGNTYTLQLSIYAYMCSMYGFNIKGLVLFHIRPLKTGGEEVKAHVLTYRRKEIMDMLTHSNRL
jgi:hypothetical protein